MVVEETKGIKSFDFITMSLILEDVNNFTKVLLFFDDKVTWDEVKRMGVVNNLIRNILI